jgi:hypothetical protein
MIRKQVLNGCMMVSLVMGLIMISGSKVVDAATFLPIYLDCTNPFDGKPDVGRFMPLIENTNRVQCSDGVVGSIEINCAAGFIRQYTSNNCTDDKPISTRTIFDIGPCLFIPAIGRNARIKCEEFNDSMYYAIKLFTSTNTCNKTAPDVVMGTGIGFQRLNECLADGRNDSVITRRVNQTLIVREQYRSSNCTGPSTSTIVAKDGDCLVPGGDESSIKSVRHFFSSSALRISTSLWWHLSIVASALLTLLCL